MRVCPEQPEYVLGLGASSDAPGGQIGFVRDDRQHKAPLAMAARFRVHSASG